MPPIRSQHYSKRDGATFSTRARDIILMAALLAFGVVAWAYFFHVRILGEEDVSLRGPLLHLATDSILALPPAVLAALVGLSLAQRFGTAPRQGQRLVVSAILVSLAFSIVMAPSILLHGYIDSAVFGEWDVHHGVGDDDFLGLTLHSLRDAFLSLAGVLPLVLVGLTLLSLVDSGWLGARQRAGPLKQVSPQSGPSSLFDREVSRREVLK